MTAPAGEPSGWPPARQCQWARGGQVVAGVPAHRLWQAGPKLGVSTWAAACGTSDSVQILSWQDSDPGAYVTVLAAAVSLRVAGPRRTVALCLVKASPACFGPCLLSFARGRAMPG